MTISVTLPDGTRLEVQKVANDSECAFAKWAMVLLDREDTRPVPDLQEVVRQVCEERNITE